MDLIYKVSYMLKGVQIAVNEQASIFQLDTQQMETLKNKSIQDLLVQNVAMKWVTRSDRPIPSAGHLQKKPITLYC